MEVDQLKYWVGFNRVPGDRTGEISASGEEVWLAGGRVDGVAI